MEPLSLIWPCYDIYGFKISIHLMCIQDAEIFVEYRPLEDTVDPTNMLCAGKVCFMS